MSRPADLAKLAVSSPDTARAISKIWDGIEDLEVKIAKLEAYSPEPCFESKETTS